MVLAGALCKDIGLGVAATNILWVREVIGRARNAMTVLPSRLVWVTRLLSAIVAPIHPWLKRRFQMIAHRLVVYEFGGSAKCGRRIAMITNLSTYARLQLMGHLAIHLLLHCASLGRLVVSGHYLPHLASRPVPLHKLLAPTLPLWSLCVACDALDGPFSTRGTVFQWHLLTLEHSKRCGKKRLTSTAHCPHFRVHSGTPFCIHARRKRPVEVVARAAAWALARARALQVT